MQQQQQQQSPVTIRVAGIPQYLGADDFNRSFAQLSGFRNVGRLVPEAGEIVAYVDFTDYQSALAASNMFNGWQGWGPRGLVVSVVEPDRVAKRSREFEPYEPEPYNAYNDTQSFKQQRGESAGNGVAPPQITSLQPAQGPSFTDLQTSSSSTAQPGVGGAMSNLLSSAQQQTELAAALNTLTPNQLSSLVNLLSQATSTSQPAAHSAAQQLQPQAQAQAQAQALPQAPGAGVAISLIQSPAQQAGAQGQPQQQFDGSMQQQQQQQQPQPQAQQTQQQQSLQGQQQFPVLLGNTPALMGQQMQLEDMLRGLQSPQGMANMGGLSGMFQPQQLQLLPQGQQQTAPLQQQQQLAQGMAGVSGNVLSLQQLQQPQSLQPPGPSAQTQLQQQKQLQQLILQQQQQQQLQASQAQQQQQHQQQQQGSSAQQSLGDEPLPVEATNILYFDNLPQDLTKREAAQIFRARAGFKSLRMVSKELPQRNNEKVVKLFVDFSDVHTATAAMKALQGYRLDLDDPTSYVLKPLYGRPPKHTNVRGPGFGSQYPWDNGPARGDSGSQGRPGTSEPRGWQQKSERPGAKQSTFDDRPPHLASWGQGTAGSMQQQQHGRMNGNTGMENSGLLPPHLQNAAQRSGGLPPGMGGASGQDNPSGIRVPPPAMDNRGPPFFDGQGPGAGPGPESGPGFRGMGAGPGMMPGRGPGGMMPLADQPAHLLLPMGDGMLPMRMPFGGPGAGPVPGRGPGGMGMHDHGGRGMRGHGNGRGGRGGRGGRF